jgi:hypothetical protein
VEHLLHQDAAQDLVGLRAGVGDGVQAAEVDRDGRELDLQRQLRGAAEVVALLFGGPGLQAQGVAMCRKAVEQLAERTRASQASVRARTGCF